MTSQCRHYCFWRTRSLQSTPPRKCCHDNSKGSTLKLLPFNKFLYIFRKSHQIWLNYLSSSLSYGQKTSRVVPNIPPGRIGLNMDCKPSFVRLLTAAAISTANSSMDITYKRVGTFNSFKDVSSAFEVKNRNNLRFSDSLAPNCAQWLHCTLSLSLPSAYELLWSFNT